MEEWFSTICLRIIWRELAKKFLEQVLWSRPKPEPLGDGREGGGKWYFNIQPPLLLAAF